MTGGAAFNEVFLDEVYVPDRRRLGAEGEGWKIALTTLAHERNAMGSSPSAGRGSWRPSGCGAGPRRGARDDPVVRDAFGELVSQLRWPGTRTN